MPRRRVQARDGSVQCACGGGRAGAWTRARRSVAEQDACRVMLMSSQGVERAAPQRMGVYDVLVDALSWRAPEGLSSVSSRRAARLAVCAECRSNI